MSSLGSLPRRTAKSIVRSVSSTVVEAVGKDVTEGITGRTSLVVAPHPDDETLGCGATIARMRAQGTQVFVLLVTGGGQSPRPRAMTTEDMIALRRDEAARALALLDIGADCITMLGFEDGGLRDARGAISEAVVEVIATTRVDQVMVTSFRDRHVDHVAVAEATLVAVARDFPSIRLYEYPVWQRSVALNVARDLGGSVATRLRPMATSPRRARPHLVSTHGFLARKRQAISMYASQLPHFPPGFVEDFLLPFETFTEVVSLDPS